MSSLSADTQRAVAVLAVGLAVIFGMWMVVISPKKDDSAAAGDRADRQEQRLSVAQTRVAANTAAKSQFPALKAELKRLDVAVPARADIADMLRSLQAEARRRGADLRVVSLKAGTGAVAAPAAGAPAAAGAAPSVTGAVPGANGLSTLPFTMEFTGRYQALLHVLRTVRRAVTAEKDGMISARSRLLTIDGLAFERPRDESAITKATLNTTAYIATPASATTTVAGTAAATGAAGSPVEKARAAAATETAAANTSVEVKP